jgi:hypothetical protein
MRISVKQVREFLKGYHGKKSKANTLMKQTFFENPETGLI